MIEIGTKRLKLRKWRISDSQDLFEYGKNELVGPNAGWPPHESEETSKEIISIFLENNDVYAIELKSEKKVIGGIGLHERKPDENNNLGNQREIGYVINPSYWGNAYAPEAVEGLLALGFNVMGLDVVWCGHFEGNSKSKRVIEKSCFNYKFKKDEIKPLLNDKKVVTHYYCVTKKEYFDFIRE
ncbi:MAG: GNAT family N-acetyltransferase [Spirochaetaceae bacterium]